MGFNLGDLLNPLKMLTNPPRLPGLPPLPGLPGLPGLPSGGGHPPLADQNQAQTGQLHAAGAVDLDNVNLDNEEKTALVNYVQLAVSDGKFTSEEQRVYQDIYRLFARGKGDTKLTAPIGGNPEGGGALRTIQYDRGMVYTYRESAKATPCTPPPACPPPPSECNGQDETARAFAQLDRTGNGLLSGNEIPPDVRAYFPGRERITLKDFRMARDESAAVRRDEAEFNQRNINGDGWLDGSEARGVEHLDRGNNFISNGREFKEISKEEFMRGRATERAQRRANAEAPPAPPVRTAPVAPRAPAQAAAPAPKKKSWWGKVFSAVVKGVKAVVSITPKPPGLPKLPGMK